MAKQIWNNPIDKSVDWGGDESTNNFPVSGEMIQKFIKDSLNQKAGIFYYDTSSNRYLIFADEIDRDLYLQDPTQTSLIIGAFDAPFNFTAIINLTSKAYNAVFLNSTGNYIDFTFDVVNKQGASTGENVTVTYTFIRNASKQTVTETKKFGDVVHFNIDKYIGEGTNTIMVGITGQTSLAATSVAITYQVVNLQLHDNFDIAKAYNLTNGPQQVEIPFTVSGYGTKTVEWYLDGELLPFIKSEDEVVDVSTSRTKYITLSNLNQGVHSLQIRAYTVINGEKFYTDTLYRDLLVYTGTSTNVILGIATTIPRDYGILGLNDAVAIYDMVQYVPYTLRFATYSPLNAANTEVTISIDSEVKGVVGTKNNTENLFVVTSSSDGTKILKLSAGNVSKEIAVVVKKTTMNIQEIEGAIIDFTALGKSNVSSDRDTWTNGVYTGTLTGFNWNNSSGWVNGRLEMSAGSSLAIDYAPLSGNPANTGKTIEIEWSTKNVTNDNAIICDLRGENGVGILITATKVSMISADGVIIETEYKSDENVRIGFVINKANGVTNRRLSFIYTNGIISRADQWAATDNYSSDAELLFTATNEVEISLKSIRIYNTALSSDNMLNNYILYRDTIAEMMEVYDRNDIYEEGTTVFSPEKMMNRLPVMIVTGDIPTLENTSDKNEQIVVDIEYYNMQDPSRNFTMKNAAMRPQGTSSMGYPKKNFRIYTEKVANTELYDANGVLVEDKLYSFRDKAQPVNCWCLKADYAESSGTHNVGIARLWNDALYNAQIDGEYKFRTEAQRRALAAGYEYDVRTTIDGFPILLFYRPQVNDDLIFIGKYNFNNDKSTEKVFGFTDIPGFDNSRMQCWEILNNGNALALFTTTAGFDEDWSEAFESRYPDTKTPYLGDLKNFCEWMSTVNPVDFIAEKWEHLDVYKMAAYWIYLMRHAAADQFAKNAMLTSEDGEHFYFIHYDNDTINGLINTGHLRITPTDGRQTVDNTGSYLFAGHDSRLWNMLEADEEFMSLVSTVDNALYSAGISYANTIKIFDEDQADKWVEKVYNQDAQYKYIGPYVEKGINNLFMLQGKRDIHRRWWLAKRFSIYDAKYVSGSYKSQAVEIKCLNGTEAGQKFTIKAGYPLEYGYGINNLPRSYGIPLEIGDTHEFTTQEVINIGDPLRIYGAPNISEIDFSKMSDRLAVVTITNVYDENLGTKLTKLVLGNPNKINAEVAEISGLKQAVSLEELDIQGMSNMNSIDLSNHQYFKILKAFGSGIASATFTKGAPVELLEFPTSLRTLTLTQLPYLTTSNILFEDISGLQAISVSECPHVSKDFDFAYHWFTNKASRDLYCYLVMDNVLWENIDINKFLELIQLKNEGTLDLKGKVSLPNATLEEIYAIRDVFGDTTFYPTADFYVDVPSIIGVVPSAQEVYEGDKIHLTAEIYPVVEGTFVHEIIQGREGCYLDEDDNLITTETAEDTSNIIIKTTFYFANSTEFITRETEITVRRRVYPTDISISGNPNFVSNTRFSLLNNTENVNGSYTIQWSLNGDLASNYHITTENFDNTNIILVKDSTPVDTMYGTIKAEIIRNFDNHVVAIAQIDVRYDIIWPTEATLIGNENPVLDNEYYTIFPTENTTGIYTVAWALEGEITDYIDITHSDETTCTLRVVSDPYFHVQGNLVFRVSKTYNDETLILIRKELNAIIPDVIINSKDNAPIQEALYKSGLVAHENYSLKEEIKRITYRQLNPDESGPTTSIFYSHRASITHFEEFEHFTGVTRIPKHCFSYLTKMTKINLPPTITTVANYSFGVTSSTGAGIKEIIIPEGTTSLGEYAFTGCSSLTSVSLPTTLTSIGKYCFSNCSAMVSIELPESLTSLGEYSFYTCKSLTQITIPSKITTLNSGTFSYCRGFKQVVIPATVTTIKNDVFNSCSSLTEITILGQIASLGDRLFISCTHLVTVNLPDSITSIGNRTFDNCQRLESFTLPAKCKSIGSRAFSGCKALKELICQNATAPSVSSDTFGDSVDTYTGRNTYNTGENFLRIPSNATGYEESYWGSVLLNSECSGFSVYGKLVIECNRDDANFIVTYTDINNNTVSITTGRGTLYLTDILYETVLTLVPVYLEGAIFDHDSITIVFNRENNKITNNAQIYFSQISIEGPSLVTGGERTEFSVKAYPENANTDLICDWSLVYDDNGSENYGTLESEGLKSYITLKDTLSYNTRRSYTISCTAASSDGRVTRTVSKKIYHLDKKENGVYIQHVSGALISRTHEFSYIECPVDEVNGIAIVSDEHSFVMALQNASDSVVFGGLDKTISGISNATTSEAAISVLKSGRADTNKIISALKGTTDSAGIVGAPAAEAASQYIFPNGKRGYLGTVGEWYMAYNNGNEVNNCLNALGQSNYAITWTSTGYGSNSYMWYSGNSANKPSISSRDRQRAVRACCEL